MEKTLGKGSFAALESPRALNGMSFEAYNELQTKIDEANVNLVDSYLRKLDWKVNENSNMSYSIQGLNNYIASEISKNYWLNKIYPEHIKNAHVNGDIHIHDLNIISVYCVGWDLKDLLTEGFKGVAGKIESAPAKHFRTALGQIVNFMYTMQGEAAGAQAFSNFDTLLAPFIRYDGLNYAQVKQAIQEFVFNMNVPTRVGFQTPFPCIESLVHSQFKPCGIDVPILSYCCCVISNLACRIYTPVSELVLSVPFKPFGIKRKTHILRQLQFNKSRRIQYTERTETKIAFKIVNLAIGKLRLSCPEIDGTGRTEIFR